MKFLLHLKHWQLFIILVVLPLVICYTSMIFAIINGNFENIFSATMLIMGICFAVFFAWLYALGTNLHKKLPETVKMNLVLFKTFLFITMAFLLFFSFYMSRIFVDIDIYEDPIYFIDPIFFVALFPLQIFSMFCIIYCLFFTSKAMKSVEWQKPVSFNDYAGEFFLIWFFPLGIWFIQPRINKIFEKQDSSKNIEKE